MPLGEALESQQDKQEKLKRMSQQTSANREETKQLMKLTLFTQRKQVNEGKNIKDLLREWPYWFSELGKDVHFKELAGVALEETDLKGKRLLNFMSTVCMSKSNKFLLAATKVKMLRGAELSGCSEDVKEMVLLLMAYFEEREEMMLSNVEDTCLAREVQTDKLPLTPTIIVCGKLTFDWCGIFFMSRRILLVFVVCCFERESVFERKSTCLHLSMCVCKSVRGQKCFRSTTICFT